MIAVCRPHARVTSLWQCEGSRAGRPAADRDTEIAGAHLGAWPT